MLTTSNLNFEVEGKVILSQIQVEMVPGEMLAVLGPNGAGKSSLLKCLSGDVASVTDQIELSQKTLDTYSPMQLAAMRAVMPQSVYLDFPFLVSEVIDMALPAKVERSQRKSLIIEALDRFDVADLVDRNYLTLSGGEQQRVQLSRVVAQLFAQQTEESKYLFLDECTSSLDLAHQHQVFEEVRTLIDQSGLSVMVVLHDLNLASQYADRIVLMKNGKVICQGQAQTVLTETLIDEVYGFKSQVIQHPKGWPLVIPA